MEWLYLACYHSRHCLQASNMHLSVRHSSSCLQSSFAITALLIFTNLGSVACRACRACLTANYHIVRLRRDPRPERHPVLRGHKLSNKHSQHTHSATCLPLFIFSQSLLVSLLRPPTHSHVRHDYSFNFYTHTGPTLGVFMSLSTIT